MATTSSKNKLVLLSRDTSNNSITTNFGYTNPDASNYAYKHTAQLLNSLTNNTFVGAGKYIYTDVTDATEE